MAQKTLTTSYLAQLTNANHDGMTQQIDDRLQGFEWGGDWTSCKDFQHFELIEE